ncbi:MAG: rRNA cytosine-C5-methylase, partial [Alistipes sp.]|nr:rRNA cytosine-C5-methylase [Alistipes sp.]
MELPKAFVERMNALLGEAEASALCAALEADEPTSVRLHPLREAQCSHLEVADVVPWSERGRYLKRRPSFTLDAAFHGGAYYVQEASSQFVGRLLAGEQMAGKRLLDLCAAPGGKSTLYASLVGEEGLVVANEVDRRRVQILADNVRKWGLGNVVVTTNEA